MNFGQAAQLICLYDTTPLLIPELMTIFHCARKTVTQILRGRMYQGLISRYFDGIKLWRKS